MSTGRLFALALWRGKQLSNWGHIHIDLCDYRPGDISDQRGKFHSLACSPNTGSHDQAQQCRPMWCSRATQVYHLPCKFDLYKPFVYYLVPCTGTPRPRLCPWHSLVFVWEHKYWSEPCKCRPPKNICFRHTCRGRRLFFRRCHR